MLPTKPTHQVYTFKLVLFFLLSFSPKRVSNQCYQWSRLLTEAYSNYKIKRVKLWVLQTRQKPKGMSSMPHPAESGDRSHSVCVAGSDLTDYANPPRHSSQTFGCGLFVADHSLRPMPNNRQQCKSLQCLHTSALHTF
jgi:hypothetical protein